MFLKNDISLGEARAEIHVITSFTHIVLHIISLQEMYRHGGQNVKDELQRHHLRPALVASFLTIQTKAISLNNLLFLVLFLHPLFRFRPTASHILVCVYRFLSLLD